MPVRPDLGPRVGAADEGVVARHRAVRIDPHDLAEPHREILRLLAIGEAVALRDEQGAVAAEDETGPEVIPAVHLRLLLVDHADVLEASLAEPPARHGRSGDAAGSRLRVGEVDRAVLGKAGVDRDVEQAALAPRRHVRHAGDGVGHAAVSLDVAQPPRTLGHEHAAVRQERQPPGMLEPSGDGFGPDDAVGRRWRRRARRLGRGVLDGGDRQQADDDRASERSA